MKEIILAEHSGFCFGVKRAIEATEEQLLKSGRVKICGELIHNKGVTEDIVKRGGIILNSLEDAEKGDTVIVRSHGESEQFYLDAENKEIKLIDMTCPFVDRIHKLVKKAGDNGKTVVIVGDKNHAEVIGISGWCKNSIIVNSYEEALKITEDELYIVAQTTIKKDMLDAVCLALNENKKHYIKENTICDATKKRQESTEAISKLCEMVVVVGDKSSSNTQKLFQIAKKHNKNVFFAEKIEDLPLQDVKKYNRIGVAAGASTPDSLIKEVIATMSEEKNMSMEELFEEEGYDLDCAMRLPRLGEIVDGTVHQVTDKGIIVDMGCKKDGLIPKEEVTLEGEQKLTDLFKAGDEIQAKVIKTDDGEGVITLSRKKLEANANWNEIVEAFENKEVLNVKVIRQVNGGVIAAYKEVTGFIPLSQLDDKFVENAEEYIGVEMDIKVTRVDQRRNRAVFSHKVIAQEERQARLEAIWNTLSEGDIVEGKVMRFTDYGAFIDLGGIDGLLHISEISWGKLKHPQEVLQIGDIVKVKILSMNAEKGKISLGLKQCTPEPWSIIHDKYEAGQIVKGKVVQIKEYGAFVELEPGLDGLVHISEVAYKRVNDISEEISVGQAVDAKILEIDTERKRISLSIKQTKEPPAPEAKTVATSEAAPEAEEAEVIEFIEEAVPEVEKAEVTEAIKEAAPEVEKAEVTEAIEEAVPEAEEAEVIEATEEAALDAEEAEATEAKEEAAPEAEEKTATEE